MEPIISNLIKEKEKILARNKEIDEYFLNNPEELKSLFLGKCFIFKGHGIFHHDCMIYLYKVKDIKLYDLNPYVQDFESENGYSIRTEEIEITEHISNYNHYISNIRDYRFMVIDNLYEIYKSLKEVSEEEFFAELEKKTGMKNIREFPELKNVKL